MPLSTSLLQAYANLPHHRGKAQVMRWCLDTFGVSVKGDQAVTRQGLRWLLNPDDYPHFNLYWFGAYDMWAVWHLERAAQPDGVFFDIGANYGYYSHMLASHLGPRFTVHAFEPNPPTMARLKRHVELNGMEKRIHLHNLGLSDQPGRAGMALRGDNSGAAFVTAGDGIELSTLDIFCRQHDIARIDVMKVDIEGAEEKFIRGGMESLDRFRPAIVIELNPPALRRSGTSAEAVAGALQGLGYELFELDRETRRPLLTLPQGEDYTDAFCVHKSKL